MYVTDTPVMDRITDTPRWETRVALDALEEALCDVQCAAEDTFGVLIEPRTPRLMLSVIRQPDRTQKG